MVVLFVFLFKSIGRPRKKKKKKTEGATMRPMRFSSISMSKKHFCVISKLSALGAVVLI